VGETRGRSIVKEDEAVKQIHSQEGSNTVAIALDEPG
jgi:hypothetical protein